MNTGVAPPFFSFWIELRKKVFPIIHIIDQKVTNEQGLLQVLLMDDDGYSTSKFNFSLSFFLVVRCSLLAARCLAVRCSLHGVSLLGVSFRLFRGQNKIRTRTANRTVIHFISRQSKGVVTQTRSKNCQWVVIPKKKGGASRTGKREISLMMVMMMMRRVFQTLPISLKKKKRERSG